MRKKNPALWITVTAVFTGMNIILSSFGVPVPGGHIYLNDIVICTAAILLDPLAAFMVGGIGAFLGDLFFYPTPMFVSLVTHGLQAVVVSLCAHRLMRKKPMVGAIIGVVLGALIMVGGYTLGRAFIYGTVETAILKLPFQIAQATTGAVVSIILCFSTGLKKKYEQLILNR